MSIIKTKAEWMSVVAALRSGKVQFSTGSQQRGAQFLADFIEDALWLIEDENEKITLDLGYDEALSVVQASGWLQIDLAASPWLGGAR
jgi:hypothetical protein